MSESVRHIEEKKELEEKINQMFGKFDFNKNNSIDENELAKAMELISPGLDKDIIHQTFLALDLDKNTQLSLEEFRQFVYKSLTSSS